MPFFLNLFEIIGNSWIPCELKKFLGYNFRHSSITISLSLSLSWSSEMWEQQPSRNRNPRMQAHQRNGPAIGPYALSTLGHQARGTQAWEVQDKGGSSFGYTMVYLAWWVGRIPLYSQVKGLLLPSYAGLSFPWSKMVPKTMVIILDLKVQIVEQPRFLLFVF
jgi:hypothetical protein